MSFNFRFFLEFFKINYLIQIAELGNYKIIFLLTLMVIAAFFEMLGIALVIPILGLIIDTSSSED